MRGTIPLLAILAVTAACGGGDDSLDLDTLESCGAVADAAITVIQEMIDLLDDNSTSGDEPDPEAGRAVEEAGEALEARAVTLGCSDEEMSRLMADLADGLEAGSVFSQLIVERLKAGEDGFFEAGPDSAG